MHRCFFTSAFLAITLVTAFGVCGDQQTKKQPLPDINDLTKAADLVNDIFKDEIAKTVDADARTKLAGYLLQQGDESGDDPAARYVLFCHARDLAILAGNTSLTLGAIDKLATHFDVGSFDLKAAALAKLVQHVPTKEPSKALTETALTLISEALNADNYEAATALGKVASEAAKKAQVVALVATVAKRNDEIAAAKEKFSVLQPFVDRLAKDANDAEANLKLGEYFGLFKGKWDRALPHLAKSKADPLATLAQKDLKEPKNVKDQAALGDAWWEYAAKQPQPQQARLQERAAYWYDKALPGLAGLSRTKAQKRIEQTSTRVQGVTPIAEGPVGFVRSLTGHTEDIRALAISSDARFGLSGSVDGTMRLWDLATGKESKIFRGHTKQVWGVAFVPDGKHVLSASWDGTVKLWDIANGQSVRAFQHPIDVNAVTVSRDGKWMLTGCDDKQMRLYDLAKGEEVKRFSPHSNFCYACAFAPNGSLVASGSADRRAMIFEQATGKLLREVEQNNAVLAIAFSPDSKYLFTCGDSAVHMWNIDTGKDEKRFEPGTGYINSMAITPDGKRLITGGEDKLVRVWDVTTGKELIRFQGHTATISAIAITPDGRRAISGQTDGNIRQWNLPPG